jgi:hypothetical protein
MDKERENELEELWAAIGTISDKLTELIGARNADSLGADQGATRAAAVELLVQGMVALAATREADPLKYLDQLRGATQDQLGDRLADVGDELERMITKAQSAVIRWQGQLNSGN